MTIDSAHLASIAAESDNNEDIIPIVSQPASNHSVKKNWHPDQLCSEISSDESECKKLKAGWHPNQLCSESDNESDYEGQSVGPSESTKFTKLSSIAYSGTNNDMSYMENFVKLINKLQSSELSSGAVKVIPPSEWKDDINFGEESKLFDHLMVRPSAQHSRKLVDGILKLTNNPLRDTGAKKSAMQLQVELSLFCLL
jgi:hypothetical protein